MPTPRRKFPGMKQLPCAACRKRFYRWELYTVWVPMNAQDLPIQIGREVCSDLCEVTILLREGSLCG